MTVKLLLLFTLSTHLAPAATPGWIQPQPDTLKPIFGARFSVDLGVFEFLRTNAEEWTQPLISKDGARVYVGTRSGRLEARNLNTNEVLWKRPDMGAIGYSMLEFRNLLVLGSDSDLVALSQSGGEERWRVALNGKIGGMASMSGSMGIFPVRPNSFIAVNLEKGEILWRTKRPTPDNITVRGQGRPAIDPARKRVYLGFSDGTLQAVRLDEGASEWSVSLGNAREFFSDVDAGPVLMDQGQHLLVASYNTGLFKLKADNGERVWQQPLLRISSLTLMGNGQLVAGTGDGQVISATESDGKVIWRYRVKKGAATPPVKVGKDLVAFGVSQGPITILELSTGRPLQLIHPGSGLSVPVAYRAPDMAVLSNKGMFLLLRRNVRGGASK